MLDQQTQNMIAANADHWMMMAKESVREAASAMSTPSAIYKPKLSIDGNSWCALYGNNLQEGVAGFGDSPHAAMCDFDNNWHKSLAKARKENTNGNN